MKKILSILLLLSCVVCVCSCQLLDSITGKEDKVSLETFTTAISASNSSNVVVDVVTKTAIGDLKAQYSVCYNADGSATINYSYEKFNEIGEGNSDETVSKVEGVMYRDESGNYSESTGVDTSKVTAAAAINLDAVKDSVVINAAGDVLTVSVPAAKTAEVFGADFGEEVKLTLTYASGSANYIFG